MTYYARIVFETNASVAERHDDVNAARGWIEAERNASPATFRLGQIFEGSQVRQVVATCDRKGWQGDALVVGADRASTSRPDRRSTRDRKPS
jgi:hypothetical protein